MKDKYLNIRVESELKEQVITLAKEERRSISDQVNYLIERGLQSVYRQLGGIRHLPGQGRLNRKRR
jgi:hypothetical protein